MKKHHTDATRQRIGRTLSAVALLFALSVCLPPTFFAGDAFWIAPAHGAADREIKEALFSGETEDEAFEQALEEAQTAKLPRQVIIEAQLLRLIRGDDTSGLIALAPAAEKALDNFKLEDSELFKTAEGAAAMLHGLRALQAAEAGDMAKFESEIKNAFWKGPEMAAVFAGWVASHRQAERMANLKVPLDTPLKTDEGQVTTLGELMKDQKAILVDFWASWCGPCMQNMPELKARSERLPGQGIPVIGINTEKNAAIAARVKKEQKLDLPWLLETPDESYSKLLDIDSIPRMVLISPEGKVLFNGHPMDPALKTALAKFNVTL